VKPKIPLVYAGQSVDGGAVLDETKFVSNAC
jgi:hypothetical protein